MNWITRHIKRVIFVGLLLLIVFLVAKNTVAKPKPTYHTVNAESRDLKQILDVTGKVEAGKQAVLRFQAGGKLVYVGAKVGDKVKKWQTIASLDKAALQKQLQKSLNDFMTNRQDFDQYRDNNNVVGDNFTSQPQLTPPIIRELFKDQLSLQNAALTVEIQDITNKLATLYSPIDGIVTQMATEVALVNVNPTDTFTIVDPDSLYFSAMVDEADLGKVTASQSAEIVLDAFPNTTISTSVISIDFTPSVGESGGTVYKVKLPLKATNATYRIGLNGQANLLLNEKKSALSLPIEAIRTKDNQKLVKVLLNGQIIDKPVKVGLETNDYVEILEGITSNDQVIVPQ
jgi:RND family efflux transporter MFP subunit